MTRPKRVRARNKATIAYLAAAQRVRDAAGTEKRGWEKRMVKQLRAEGLRVLPIRKCAEPPAAYHVRIVAPEGVAFDEAWLIEG